MRSVFCVSEVETMKQSDKRCILPFIRAQNTVEFAEITYCHITIEELNITIQVSIKLESLCHLAFLL